ncbi:HoxN/HupN/NixA family nickel/cobalt transporter [Arthrobacter sp. MMS24-T111]
MTTALTLETPLGSGWKRQEKAKLTGILGVIAALHIGGIVLYLAGQGQIAGASGLVGAGVLAYVLGMRHAFDANHIAVIDYTTRAMSYRGSRQHHRRPYPDVSEPHRLQPCRSLPEDQRRSTRRDR